MRWELGGVILGVSRCKSPVHFQDRQFGWMEMKLLWLIHVERDKKRSVFQRSKVKGQRYCVSCGELKLKIIVRRNLIKYSAAFSSLLVSGFILEEYWCCALFPNAISYFSTALLCACVRLASSP